MSRSSHLGELTKMELEYNAKYGHLPKEQQDLIIFIQQNFKIDYEKYNKLLDHNRLMEWNQLEINFDLVPRPTPRPRLGRAGKFYVSGASENKKVVKRLIRDFDVIFTATKFKVTTYQPIPTSSAKGYEILAAEEGIIRPLADPDWDNLGKTYSDMLQEYLLLNDNIIIEGSVTKYYSIRPRIKILIEYANGFDSKFNEKRIVNSKNFKTMVDPELLKPLQERALYV